MISTKIVITNFRKKFQKLFYKIKMMKDDSKKLRNKPNLPY